MFISPSFHIKLHLQKYYLTQWISKLPGSFEINWVRQYLVNFNGSSGHSKCKCLQDWANFHRFWTWQIVIIFNTAFVVKISMLTLAMPNLFLGNRRIGKAMWQVASLKILHLRWMFVLPQSIKMYRLTDSKDHWIKINHILSQQFHVRSMSNPCWPNVLCYLG